MASGETCGGRIWRPRDSLACAGLAAVVLLLAPSGAAAATRFAAPGGTGPAPCHDPASPCSLFDAASAGAGPAAAQEGDEVVLAPGVYSEAAGDLGPAAKTLELAEKIVLHGEAGKSRPVIAIDSSRAGGVTVRPGDAVSGLEVRSAVSEAPLTVRGGSVDDVVASTAASEAVACELRDGIVRDSACLAAGDDSVAASFVFVGGGRYELPLRNVTAIADGPKSAGIAVGTFSGTEVRLDGKAVIAEGTATDVRAVALVPGAIASVALEGSEFDQVEAVSGSGGVSSVTEPGTSANITAPPLLAADGIHQLAGSPTIDQGVLDPASGASDIDGEARVAGAAVDIGADEFPVARPAPPVAPDTKLKGRPRRRTASRRAIFRFGSDQAGSRFECKLDRAPFHPCRSPVRRRVKPGLHLFRVRAVNAAGLSDRTPAVCRWRVLARRGAGRG